MGLNSKPLFATDQKKKRTHLLTNPKEREPWLLNGCGEAAQGSGLRGKVPHLPADTHS